MCWGVGMSKERCVGSEFTLPALKQDFKFLVVIKNFIRLFHSPVKLIKAAASHGNFST